MLKLPPANGFEELSSALARLCDEGLLTEAGQAAGDERCTQVLRFSESEAYLRVGQLLEDQRELPRTRPTLAMATGRKDNGAVAHRRWDPRPDPRPSAARTGRPGSAARGTFPRRSSAKSFGVMD